MYIAVPAAKELLDQRNAALLSAQSDDSGNFADNLKFIKTAPDTALNFFAPGSDEYKSDIEHWAVSSAQNSLVTVQPDNAQDVAELLKYLSANRLSFGVKSGGHSANPGFSSSPAILISMKRFNQVVYDPVTKTAMIGVGQTWNTVYKKLNDEYKVNVLGARVSNIGVAGFVLGGGYSWQTNQYGLALDTITAFELVKPDGTIVNVTPTSDPDLFFAVRGGGNNFGIITNITMKTFSQGRVWGGSILLGAQGSESDKAKKIKDLFFAVQKFVDEVQPKHPKAALLASLGNFPALAGTTHLLNLVVFYDGPEPPADTFDIFKKIAPTETAELWKERDFLDLVENAFFYEGSVGSRGSFHTVPLAQYTHELLQTIWDENEYWGSNPTVPAKDRLLHTYSVEPFVPDILSHSQYPSAYPANRSVAYSPFPIYASWSDPKSDAAMQAFVKETTDRIRKAAIDQNIEIGASYPNYAISGTPLEEMYGNNVGKLKAIKKKVDPNDVMGLAGGFKF